MDSTNHLQCDECVSYVLHSHVGEPRGTRWRGLTDEGKRSLLVRGAFSAGWRKKGTKLRNRKGKARKKKQKGKRQRTISRIVRVSAILWVVEHFIQCKNGFNGGCHTLFFLERGGTRHGVPLMSPLLRLLRSLETKGTEGRQDTPVPWLLLVTMARILDAKDSK
jgi:hypothetical protein